ncbi:MAG TPA: hypothetical protein VKV95_23470 [Terriglobia bacterium]|nr:hypothetical protein [Terriglobia bacterium]
MGRLKTIARIPVTYTGLGISPEDQTQFLVAEENPANLELMTTLLHAFGHEPIAAHNGEQGLVIAHCERPRWILDSMPKRHEFKSAAGKEAH